jgi:hypothetical protein
MLGDAEIRSFVHDGIVRVPQAFSVETAQAACAILWRHSGAEAANPATWTKPVIRLGERTEAPFLEAANSRLDVTEACRTELAVGAAGTVYLCHPFVVHAAQRHRGRTPRFIAQPPLFAAEPLELDRADGAHSPVEAAIREALSSVA